MSLRQSHEITIEILEKRIQELEAALKDILFYWDIWSTPEIKKIAERVLKKGEV